MLSCLGAGDHVVEVQGLGTDGPVQNVANYGFQRVEYPEGMEARAKSRFEMLIAAREHEMHHRGQLAVAQRMLGMTPHLTRQTEEVIAGA